MSTPHRTKKQHFIPRFYLRSFSDASGKLWTHDSITDSHRQTTPENTGFETNIYSPTDDSSERIDLIEDTLAKVESAAAPILKDLLSFRKLDRQQKTDFALFLASIFVRSPSQLRQFAQLHGEILHWMTGASIRQENRQKHAEGRLTEEDRNLEKFIEQQDSYVLNVDRRIGLSSFEQWEPMASIIERMNWSFELSDEQELITSDNSFFWVNSGGPLPVSGPYGFGLGHPQAVVPFPLSPSTILRIDWSATGNWTKFKLVKQRARLANQFQAKHKERFIFSMSNDEGFRKLGNKYATPPQQLKVGVKAPEVKVVRKLGDRV